MRVLVCGGRKYGDAAEVNRALNELPVSLVIEGGASGADLLAKLWAQSNCVPCETYEADWDKYGKTAGPIRNQRMIDEGKPEVVVALPGGPGTADMVRRARAAGIKVIEAGHAYAPVAMTKGEQ